MDIAAGRMNVENDFASSPLYCNYMNNGLCGDPKALPGGDIGHSAFPDGVGAVGSGPPAPDTIQSRRIQSKSGPVYEPCFGTGSQSTYRQAMAYIYPSRSAMSQAWPAPYAGTLQVRLRPRHNAL